MSAGLMKTKMIRSLRVLVFNDINKTQRKFHLDSVICSAPQVAPGPSDTEERREGETGESFGVGALSLVPLIRSWCLNMCCNQRPLNHYMKCRWAQLSALVRGPNVKSRKRHPGAALETGKLVQTLSPYSTASVGASKDCLHIWSSNKKKVFVT